MSRTKKPEIFSLGIDFQSALKLRYFQNADIFVFKKPPADKDVWGFEYDHNPFHEVVIIGIIAQNQAIDLIDKGAEKVQNSVFKYKVIQVTIDNPPNNYICKLDIITELWKKGTDLKWPVRNFNMPILLATNMRTLSMSLIKSLVCSAYSKNATHTIYKLLSGLNVKRVKMAALKKMVDNGIDKTAEPLMRHSFKIARPKRYRRHYSVNNSASISCIKDKVLQYVDNNLRYREICMPFKFLDNAPMRWSEVKKSLKCITDAKEKDVYGQTALHRAVKNSCCDPQLIRSILGEGVNVNEPTNIGNTALLNAVRAPCVKKEVVKELLLRGADPNVKDSNGMSVLHHCVKNPDASSDITKLLIRFDANVNYKCPKGKVTPLQVALLNDAPLDHVTELLVSGAVLGENYKCSALRTYLKCAHIKLDVLNVLLSYADSIPFIDYKLVDDIADNIHCSSQIVEAIFRAFGLTSDDAIQGRRNSKLIIRSGA
ncbi:ankyrin repeat protein [Trichonephila inaurata madagascariensis]|uniref:Ankyrin repeat protein n=1 Tax=Trichonephila inaurata madagascariensis TaxID=2747483 RepID=A0A8X7BU70_9ARAC|nr:ankyrin repeat protein [Trichonephila inaurata madagascariensis]